jgi:hypothetical protein
LEQVVKAAKKPTQYANLREYCFHHDHLKEWYIAEQAEIDPTRFSKLKRGRSVAPYEQEIAKIARLLNQSEDYVRALYGREPTP